MTRPRFHVTQTLSALRSIEIATELGKAGKRWPASRMSCSSIPKELVRTLCIRNTSV